MSFDFITHIESCVRIIEESIPVTLVYYSHIPVAIVSLLLGGMILIKNKTLVGRVLFVITFCFALWSLIDVILWTSYNSQFYMFFWSIMVIIEYFLFAGFLYLLYIFNAEHDVDFHVKIGWFVMLLPILIFVPTVYNIGYFDATYCYPVETILYSSYALPVFAVLLVWLVAISIYRFLHAEGDKKIQIFLLGASSSLFLGIFLGSNIIADYFIENEILTVPQAYNIEMYSLFLMLIFLIALAFIIVRFRALNIKLLATQVLVWAIVLLIGSQFIFIQSYTNYVLNSITLIGAVFSGILIVRSVKKVDTQRELLEKSNNEQEVLMHFITHQIKGFFTKSRNIFDTLNDEAEALSPNIARLVSEGLRSDKEGIELVENILNASNMKNGKIKFTDAQFDIDATIRKVVNDLEVSAKNKNLAINYFCTTAPLMVKADEARVKDLVRNVIQNAVLYTFKGGVNVSLAQKGNEIEFVVKDTGVGLTPGDKARLFQSGGRGEESVKYNTGSTGYGLFIAKKVVDNYNGRIWAESEGRDKGSKFTVVLPIAQPLVK